MAAPSKRLGPEFEKAQQNHELERYKSILRNPNANAATKKMAQQRIDEGTQREGGSGSGPHKDLDSRINGVIKSVGATSDPKGKKVLARHLDNLSDEMLDTVGHELSSDKSQEGGPGSGPHASGSSGQKNFDAIGMSLKSPTQNSKDGLWYVPQTHWEGFTDKEKAEKHVAHVMGREAGAEEPFTPPDSGSRPEGYVDPRYTSLKQPVVQEAQRGWTSPGVYVPPRIKQESAKINIKEF